MVPLRDICAGEGVRVVGADVGRDVWLRIGWVVGLLVGLFDETDDDVKFGLGVGF
jgi:tetrahydromethanopterin S-methyltransferase subunit G